MKNEDVLQRVSKERDTLHTTKNRWLTGLVILCEGNTFYNGLLKDR